MESINSRRTTSLGAFAFAAILTALGAAAIAASWRRIGARARKEAEREAELDVWAYADSSPPAL